MIGVFSIVLACLTWSFDTLVRYPLTQQGITGQQISLTEHAYLFLFFLPLIWKSRSRIWQTKLSHLFYFFMVGAVGSALGVMCFTNAFRYLNPSMVILLQKLQPVIAILLARIVLKEPIKKAFVFWATICLLGGFLIAYRDIQSLPTDWEQLNHKVIIGYALTLSAVGAWGAATVFGKKLTLLGYRTREIMAGRFTFGFVFLLPTLFAGDVDLTAPLVVWGKILFLVSFSGLLGMWFYYYGLKRVTARLSALAEMLFPFFAVGINWVFLGTELDLIQLAGGVILLCSSVWIQLKHY